MGDMKKNMMKMKILMKAMDKCMGDSENAKEEKMMDEEQD